MASRIPTSTSVTESAVIEAKFSDVWHLIKLQNFSDFWSVLEKSEHVKGSVSPETDIVKWTFKDGTVLEVKQEEHSVSASYPFSPFFQGWSECLRTFAHETCLLILGYRASTTTSPTRSYLLTLSSATPLSLALSASSLLLRESTKDILSFLGLETSRVMLMPVSLILDTLLRGWFWTTDCQFT
jgi:hypothetical protein